MLRSLITASTGMVAQQQNIDTIANNLANVNTTGFKQQRAEFQDLMYQTLRSAGIQAGSGPGAPGNQQVGLGVKFGATANNFSQGSLQNTNSPLNMAITGDGFFRVLTANGQPALTRDGTFRADGTGRVVTSDGFPLDPPLTIPPGAMSLTISTEGEVSAVLPGANSSSPIGNIEVSSVVNPAGLSRAGNNLFFATEASGEPQSGPPGQNGTGKIQSGYVEGSNVQVVEEMVHMIAAQRAYEINSKAIQTSDDMLGIVNNLKR